MTWIRRRLAESENGADSGITIVVVVTSFAMLFALVLVTSLYVVNEVSPTARFEREEQALSAAESGITDYLTRINGTDRYWEAVDCTNVAMRRPLGDDAPVCGWDDGVEPGWVAVETGAEVAADGEEPAFHYEVMDDEALGAATRDGSQARLLTLQVTGRARGETRTLDVEVRRDSTEEFAGFQDYWYADPVQRLDALRDFGVTTAEGSGRQYCPLNQTEGFDYYWSDDPDLGACSNQGYGSTVMAESGTGSRSLWGAAPIQGDFFMNDLGFRYDRIFANGERPPATPDSAYTIDGTFTTANPDCTPSTLTERWSMYRRYPVTVMCGRVESSVGPRYTTTTEAWATFGKRPETSSVRSLPTDTSALEEAPGCRYYGATRIVLNEDGTMRVWSESSGYPGLTLAVEPTWTTGTPLGCGSAADLTSDAGALVQVPEDMVVQVLDVPDEVVKTHTITNGPLNPGEVGGDATHGWVPSGHANIVSMTDYGKNSYVVDAEMLNPHLFRTEGNLWVEGLLKGTMTLSTPGSVIVTGDLVRAEATDEESMLGIVAGGVEVVQNGIYRLTRVLWDTADGGMEPILVTPLWHHSQLRYEATSSTQGTKGDWPHDYDGRDGQVTIEAAIQAVTYSFTVQQSDTCLAEDWFKGYAAHASFAAQPTAARSLVIRGSVAQRFVGDVGYENLKTGASCGLLASVQYDDRLTEKTPPYLLRFTNVPWSAGSTSESTTPDRLRG
jgi:hypothetical protein